MLSFTESICRVGSRSQNERLIPYQINNLLYQKRGIPQFSEDNSTPYHNTRMKIKELTGEIENITNIIEVIKYEIGILNIESFEVFSSIIPAFFKQFILKNSMTYFLTNNYNHIPYCCNAENFYHIENKTFDNEKWDDDDELDEEMRMFEDHHRKLDEGGYADSNYGRNKCVTFEIHLKKLEDCVKSTKSIVDKFYLENLLNDLKNTLQEYQNMQFTVQECKILQKQFLRNLNFVDRFKLYNFWKFQLVENYKKKISELENEVCQLNNSLLSQKDLVYLDIMKNVHVVGMTTTAAAQHNNILRDLAPPIVIVEEAAEIMESHVVTSLSSKCKHLILIGDHQQLKPKPNVHELGSKYNLDKSFFERMVNNGIVYHTLEYQHRMRPSISNLLVPTIYKNLKDHESVFSYPDVKGVKKNLFFIDHKVYESPPVQEFQSYENPHEAKFLLGLCRHFLYQDYTNDDITILTPYLGQFRLFKKLQKGSEFDKCRGVRICVLDNYQGEESNIILLSLVRSNEEKKVGFMKIENRVNVALSRAKHGMFIIGNMSQMAEASELWKEINKKLIDGSNIGPELHLDCYCHPSKVITIKSYEEFLQKSPEGGCELPCTVALPKCGHNCPMQYCHGFDRGHLHFRCVERCLKTCELGHHCPEKCFEKCPPCRVLVDKVLPCGHTHNMRCFIPPVDYNCPTIVEKILPVCKHSLNVACYKNIYDVKCKEPCTIRLDCGHKCNLNCHPTDDPNHEKYLCQAPCERIPKNCEFDHKCLKPCSRFCGICLTLIDRQLKCGHLLKNVKCGIPENALKCENKCERILDCGHICPKLCYQKCGDCIEKVSKVVPGCKHTVDVPCSVLPNENLCLGKCVKRLPCGHQCTMKCYQKCSSKCMHLVESSIHCPKNHRLQILCHINQSIDKLATNPQGLKMKYT
ncbi:NFX1-type zinc finger-containing protein 1 [Armadillidium nasatum]|uniref:NFX1-type zinc finger-containing protein 1 n=1 Tax=Armadillidium nasatum TaxID=96803 RepID=A0A5N5SVM1_9CRUS|nr:NFX1-type zinc finger-containing protein 1 [Armadillidium nasatum]